MYLKRHSVKNFRNISEIEFFPDRTVSVISGENGQGKTNLLESVYLLSGGRGFRSGKDRDFIKIGEDSGLIKSDFFALERNQNIEISITESGRQASLNGGVTERATLLAGRFCCVLFSPEHLMLVKGSPEQRRRFIDMALCQIFPKYISEIHKYTRLVKQKNTLLKDCQRISAAYDMLEVFDIQIAEAAKTVTDRRIWFAENIAPVSSLEYEGISGNREILSLKYSSTIWTEKTDFEEGLFELERMREQDIKTGVCNIGPHRDDLDITLDGNESRVFASQGQQRSIVLSLKLAEASLIEKSLNDQPILLLDDLLSELDENRQNYLIKRLFGFQAIITGCDGGAIAKKTGAAVFDIKNGALV